MTTIDHNQIQMNRIHSLMNSIEDKTGKMFHEFNIELFERYKKVCEGIEKKSYFINTLTKLYDSLNQ